MNWKLSKRQSITLLLIAMGNLFNSMCISLQAPFYPQEAELKGATASQYGFVFGTFELVGFIVAPIFGNYINRIGPKLLFSCGLLTTSISSSIFGTLVLVDGSKLFIGLSLLFRVIEGIGNAAFLTASFPIIAKEFPNSVATTFASMETFFGVGLFIGPMFGGLLYAAGGFYLPFLVIGIALFITTIMTSVFLPDIDTSSPSIRTENSSWSMLKIPVVQGFLFGIVVTSASIGFLSAILEAHLASFQLSPPILGLFFIVTGAFYAFGSPLIGFMIDRFLDPKICVFFGALSSIIGYSLIGPAPFLPLEKNLYIISAGLLFYGFGVASTLIACFSGSMRSATEHGYPDSTETYGFISGLMSSIFSLGAFIGPSVAGLLYDAIGFARATIFMIYLEGILAVVFLLLLILKNRSVIRFRNRFMDPENEIISDDERKHEDLDDETIPLIK